MTELLRALCALVQGVYQLLMYTYFPPKTRYKLVVYFGSGPLILWEGWTTKTSAHTSYCEHVKKWSPQRVALAAYETGKWTYIADTRPMMTTHEE